MSWQWKHIGTFPPLERQNGETFYLSHDMVKQQKTLYNTMQMLTAVITRHPTVETFAFLASFDESLRFTPDDTLIKQWFARHEDEVGEVVSGPLYTLARHRVIERGYSAVLRGDWEMVEEEIKSILPSGAVFMGEATKQRMVQGCIDWFKSDGVLLDECCNREIESLGEYVTSLASDFLFNSPKEYDYVIKSLERHQLIVNLYMADTKYERLLPEMIESLKGAKGLVSRLEQVTDAYDPGDLEYRFPLRADSMSGDNPQRSAAEAYERKRISTTGSLADALRMIDELAEEHQQYALDRLTQTMRAAQQPGMMFYMLSDNHLTGVREYATNPVGMILTAEESDPEKIGLTNEAAQLRAAADNVRQNIGEEAYNGLLPNERSVYILAELMGDSRNAAMASLAARRYFGNRHDASNIEIVHTALQCTNMVHVPPGILRGCTV